MATSINISSIGTPVTGITVADIAGTRTVTFSDTVLSGTYSFNSNGGATDQQLKVQINGVTASLNVVDTSFERQVSFSLRSEVVSGVRRSPTLTLSNITSYSEDPDLCNIEITGSPSTTNGPVIHIRDTNIFTETDNQSIVTPIFNVHISTTNIYLGYNVSATNDEFTYVLPIKSVCDQCTFYLGNQSAVDTAYISFSDITNRLPNVYVESNVVIENTTVLREIVTRVKNGKTLTFDNCIINEYTSPQATEANWSGDNTLLTLQNISGYVNGTVHFNPTTVLYPRVAQVKEVGAERIISTTSWGRITGFAHLHYLPSNYSVYNASYTNSSFIKNSIIELNSGDYVFGSNSNHVSFDLNFLTNSESTASNVELHVNGGNIWFDNQYPSTSHVTWSGYVIGRSNQNGGRDCVFDVSSAFDVDFSGLTLVANAGNNILNSLVTEGTFSNNFFSYYPSIDFSYDLTLENQIVVGTSVAPTPIPLYSGAINTYGYNFYSNNIYRPSFYLGKNSSSVFDLGTDDVLLKNCVFNSGVTLDVSGTFYSNSSTYYGNIAAPSPCSCIDLLASSVGTLVLNSNNAEGNMNNFYIDDDVDVVVASAVGSSTLITYNYNNYHLTAGTWDFNATGLSSYSNYITADNNGGAGSTTGRPGVIVLSGSYTFTNVPDLEFNLQIDGNTTVSNTTFTQTVYVFGSSNLTFSTTLFQPVTNAVYIAFPGTSVSTSLVGGELVNLDSSATGFTRTFNGLIYLGDATKFYLPHGKKCMSDINSLDDYDSNIQVILTSTKYNYYISSSAEPLTYNLAKFYLDSALAADVTVFGTEDSTAIDKAFQVNTIASSGSDTQYLTGRMSRLNLVVNSNTASLGVPSALMGRVSESNLKKLHLDGAGEEMYALDIVSGSAQVSMENVTFEYPGSKAFVYVQSGYDGRLDFTSTDNAYIAGTPDHIAVLWTSGNMVLDLGNETFPATNYNKFFWPTLWSTNSRPLISTQGYVAESWTNNPEYYNNTDSGMYLVNDINGLSKPNAAYEQPDWTANGEGTHDRYFYVAYGLDTTGTVEISLNLINNYSDYHNGAIYNGGVGLNTLTKTTQLYKTEIILRWVDFANLYTQSKTVVTTFAETAGNLWSEAPVPLTYKIDNQLDLNNYALTTQVSINGGASWSDAIFSPDSSVNIVVSESEVNGTGNLRFVYQDGSANLLTFEADSSMTFSLDTSFVEVGAGTDLNAYVLSWPMYQNSSDTLTIKPVPSGYAWNYRNATASNTEYENSTQFRIKNIDDEGSLLVSDTTSFTGVNSAFEFTIPNEQVTLNLINDKYYFDVSFFLMTHVLPPDGTGTQPLSLGYTNVTVVDIETNSVDISPVIMIDVSGTGNAEITSTDVPAPTALTFTIDNSLALTANTDYTMTLVIDDLRNIQDPSGSHVNPITTPVTLTINFRIPLFVYLNTTDSRTDQTISGTISKGIDSNLYVYLSSKYSSVSNYVVNFTLSGDNVNKDFSVNVLANTVSSAYILNLVDDYKIWGNAGLTLTADVSLVNTINYTYTEARNHEVRVLLGKAIGGGYESSGNSLSTLQYSIQTSDVNIRTPEAWNQGDAAGAAYDITQTNNSSYLPITKYTPYFIEVKQGSLGFDPADVNTQVDPSFGIELRNHNGTVLVEGTDYIIDVSLGRISNIDAQSMNVILDRPSDANVHKRLYFRLKPLTDLDGPTISVRVTFSSTAGTNYQNLNSSYHIANINYTGADGNMSSTLFQDSAGIRMNTWRIIPSGDGRFLEFFHDSLTTIPVTRLGTDGVFIARTLSPAQLTNGHVIVNYVSGVNGLYDISDPVNSITYKGYVVHGFGSEEEMNQPWLVICSTDNVSEYVGQGSSDFYNMPYLAAEPSGNNVYEPFLRYKGAQKVGIVTGSLTATDTNAWKTFQLVQDADWATGNYSFYDALYNADQFLANAQTDYTDDDTVFQTPSTYNITAAYSGTAYAGALQMSRTGDYLGTQAGASQELSYFHMTGVYYVGDNDIVAMTFANSMGMEFYVDNNDVARNENQYGAKWSFWNNDFCCGDTNTSRIGDGSDKGAGMPFDEYAADGSQRTFIIVR